VKAIRTVYRNTTFRSRLEADWASSLDAMRVPWIYEPEGYELSDGSWYLPDFFLPTAKAWLEVKGAHQQRVSKVETFAADMWAESGATSTYDTHAPMILIVQGTDTDPDFRWTRNGFAPWPKGIMGPGKGYSTAWAVCPSCGVSTVIALWQPACRACGGLGGTDALTWGVYTKMVGSWQPTLRPRMSR
jgi:hypothetical protein